MVFVTKSANISVIEHGKIVFGFCHAIAFRSTSSSRNISTLARF
jgi:hypothetical protein